MSILERYSGVGCDDKWAARVLVWIASFFFGTLFLAGQAHAAKPAAKPASTTGAATSITATGATLNGTVNPQNSTVTTTVTFDYGTSKSYGISVPASPSALTGTTAQSVSAAISGLACGTTYHFRVSATNSIGTSNGKDSSFTTALCTVLPSGFVFTSSACTDGVAIGTAGQCTLVAWNPQVAGISLTNIYITSVNSSGIPTRLHPSQVRTLNLDFGLSCHDPVSDAGMQATFTDATLATTVTLPLCMPNGAQPTGTAWSAVTLTATFPGGVPSAGPYTFNYPDVGSVEFWVQDSAAPTSLGTSNAFVVRPDHFDLNVIRQTAVPNLVNPAATNTAGAKFVKAGEPFSVTVTARNSANAATPNYGKETAPESVKLTPVLVAPAGGNNPPVGGTFGTFTGGVAIGTNFTWNEVGIITLTPSVGDGNYLGVGDVTGTISGNVGRFYAAQFALSSGVIANRTDIASCAASGCGTSTYMGERFDARFTLTAQALGGATTQNYTTANGFAKLNPAAAGNPLVFGAVDSTATPSYLTARLDTSLSASGSFTAGAANVSAPLAITRGASADGPYTLLDIGIAPQDSDGVLMAGYDLDTNAVAGNDHTKVARTEVRYGRIKLSNAYGSELLPLSIAVTAQYWNGAGYVTSITDSLSSFAVGNVVFSNWQKSSPASPWTTGSTSVVTPPASVVFANGSGSFNLAAPGTGNTGSVDMTTNVPTYLPGSTARATFGVYKGSSEFIYLRENY